MRFLIRWVFRLVVGLIILAVVCVVAGILLVDTLTREALVNRLRAKTGMEVKIGAVHVGLLSPTLSIEGLKLYNKPEFGDSLCLDMPELHIEYDASALRARRIHITLLRLELAEVSVLQNKDGRNNFDSLPRKNRPSSPRKDASNRLEFIGIDVMNVTLGKFRLFNATSGQSEEIDFAIKNQILRHVKSEKDLAPLGLTTLTHGKASTPGDAEVDLGQLFDSLMAAP